MEETANMTIDDLIAKAQADGLTLAVDGGDIMVTAPTWEMLHAWTPLLKAHKPVVVQRLSVCPTCGANAWRETPDGGRWCEPCVMAGRVAVVAVKIWSDTLEAALWAVADDLPRDQWPQDAPVYTYREMQELRQTSPDVLQWVHITKEVFGASLAHVETPEQERGDAQ
jgi:hypothetical protein